MSIKELENHIHFDAVLGYLGVQFLNEVNAYYARFSYNQQWYILYQSQTGSMCLNLKTLSRLTPIEFLLYHIDDRSVLGLERTSDNLKNLPDHILCKIPDFRPIKESQLLANVLGIESIVDYTVSEEEDSSLFQFIQHLDNNNCAVFSGMNMNEYVMCIYQKAKLINAITFNLGTRIEFLTERDFHLKLSNKNFDKRIFISNINYLINKKLFNQEAEIFLFRFFHPSTTIQLEEPDKETQFIVPQEQYPVVLQILFKSIVKHNIFSSASVRMDQQSNSLSIHISGYGKKPFTIEQLSEPIKYKLKKSLSIGSALPKHPLQEFILNESYYHGTGNLLQFTNSKANDFILDLPLKREYMVPLFDHFASLLPVKYSLTIIY